MRTNSEPKYLSFFLGKEEFAVSAEKIKGVQPQVEITSVPVMPSIFQGLVVLNDHVIPVMNLRRRFNISEGHAGNDSSIIIVQEGDYLLGLLVDSYGEECDLMIHESGEDARTQNTWLLSEERKNEDEFVKVLNTYQLVYSHPEEMLGAFAA